MKAEAYRVTSKENAMQVVHLCLTCAVQGVDPDMQLEVVEVDGDAGTLSCELCGAIIVEEEPS